MERIAGDDLRKLLAALPDLVVMVGRDRKIRYVNRTEPGYTREDVVGEATTEFVTPPFRERHLQLLDGVFETGEPAEQLTEAVGVDDKTEWYEGYIMPLEEEEGRVVSVAIVSRNVTARVRAERELERVRSLLPLCAWCKRVRTAEDDWLPLETYLEKMSESRVTHGICPDCEVRERDQKEPAGGHGQEAG